MFLKRAGAAGGVVLAGGALAACSDDADGDGASTKAPSRATTTTTGRRQSVDRNGVPQDSILGSSARNSPIDHVVVVMMENRSFDHWLGWLSLDEQWLEAGKRRYADFDVIAKPRTSFPQGDLTVDTQTMTKFLDNPWRGCGHPDPGHGWEQGRAQRDGGFLAEGSGNDEFALGYYLGDDLPFSSALARRFTVCDQSFASILGPTFPNREYLHSAQSGGTKTNVIPSAEGGFKWETIWDRLDAAGVEHGYYYNDLPVLMLWGQRMSPWVALVDDYFTRCEEGTLPAVSFVDPGFTGDYQTDNHPLGDVRSGEAFVRDVFAAFARSKHWEKGLFILTYDEWGGFFDHVAPPTFPDDRASDDDLENFGQAGFRIPTVLASPYARPGSVDHRVYDHTSVLRFLEWRFLGAPPDGRGSDQDSWYLTQRDRSANNIGATLVTRPTKELDIELDVTVDDASPPCPPAEPAAFKHAFEDALDAGYFEQVGFRFSPSLMARGWQV